jgi:hypothetical protein
LAVGRPKPAQQGRHLGPQGLTKGLLFGDGQALIRPAGQACWSSGFNEGFALWGWAGPNPPSRAGILIGLLLPFLAGALTHAVEALSAHTNVAAVVLLGFALLEPSVFGAGAPGAHARVSSLRTPPPCLAQMRAKCSCYKVCSPGALPQAVTCYPSILRVSHCCTDLSGKSFVALLQ